MEVNPQDPIPSFAAGWLQSAVTGLLTIVVGTYFWLHRRMDGRVTDIEKAQKDDRLATQLKIAELASRQELMAHMAQMREDFAAREDRKRSDDIERHRENRDWLEKLDKSVNCLRTECREDIQAVHVRIDAMK